MNRNYKLKKPYKLIIALCLVTAVILCACSMYMKYSKENGGNNISQNHNDNDASENQSRENNDSANNNADNENTTSDTTTGDNMFNDDINTDPSGDGSVGDDGLNSPQNGKNSGTKPPVDLSVVKPNESGKIMVVMFHNFIKEYKSGDKEYTTTFDEFRKLLETLYEKGYRLINLSDYLNNNISVPPGCIPMVFTFDDGTSSQFNLIEKDGTLVANPESAVGILEEFNRTHPDFGLKGTFFVNLGLNTFPGAGTLPERLKYLIDKGFEIGNHTFSHIKLNEAKSAEEIQKEIGGNYKKMLELVPGYKMALFSLPYGLPATELRSYVIEGEFEGLRYQNKVIVEVGANPAPSPVSKDFNPLSTPRVRAQGIEPVYMDLTWWLENLSREEQYISDGDPKTVTVPKEKEHLIDKDKLNGLNLVVY